MEAVASRRLKVSEINEVNDPYELYGIITADPKVFSHDKNSKEVAETMRMLCFCREASNPVVWGHYGENHRGLCLGFQVPAPPPNAGSAWFNPVNYRDAPEVLSEGDAEQLLHKMFFNKYDHWRYESEIRLVVLSQLTVRVGEHSFFPFGHLLALREIVLGYRNPYTKAQITDQLRTHGHNPEDIDIWKVKPSRTEFKMIRDVEWGTPLRPKNE